MSNSAAVVATYNEEEMLPGCLAALNSMECIRDIVIVDSFSTDRTPGIVERFARYSCKKITFRRSEFSGFGQQYNKCLDLVASDLDWVLYLGADEIFTPQTDELVFMLADMPHINGVCMPTLTMYADRRHYLEQKHLDPHVRIVRNGFARFAYDIHEDLVDSKGRGLNGCRDSDILVTFSDERFHDVGVKHLQLLKSEAALAMKGKRWADIGALEASCARGLPVNEGTWLEWKRWAMISNKVLELPERLYDVTSDW